MKDIYKKRCLGILAIILFLIALIMIIGTGNNQCPPRLAHIDSLMETNPQAAYDSLLHIDSMRIYDGDKATEMRLLMLKAKAQNKLYLQMPSDTVFSDVVSYYDRHGSANDRMLSRYLLGCIYAGAKEAPMALECFIDAVEQADTTSNDCDYNTLFRIHGQIASLYESQHLFDNSMIANNHFSEYALKAGDVYNYIRGKEFVGGTCFSLGDTLKALSIFKDCISLYNKHGLHKAAASAYPIIIKTYISREQYDSAHIYMDIFENESGVFVDGEIAPDRLHYYYSKGLYNIGVGKTDSAEYCFRHLLKGGFEYEAYKGLLSVYRRKMNVDSISKYSLLSEKAMDGILSKSQAEAVIQATALYDYNRMRRIADASKLREQKTLFTVYLIIAAVIILGIYVAWHVWNMRKKNRAEKERMNHRYVILSNELSESKIELENIRKGSVSIVTIKEKELEELRKRVKEQEKQLLGNKLADADFVRTYEDIVSCFKRYTIPGASKSSPTKSEWNALRDMVRTSFPKLYSLLSQRDDISEQEFNVGVLIYLGFKTGEITTILDTSKQSVSNTKSSVSRKLFDDKSAASLYNNLKKL